MSTLAFGWGERPQHGMGRSFLLSAIVHLALAAILFLGVRWQSSAPDTVTVELVDAPPPPAPVVEAPKPLPKAEPPPPPPPVEKPIPKIEKPQIAIPDKPKPKPEVKPKPKAEVKPKPEAKPKADPTFEKRMKEQMALEQQALDQQRQERELRDLLARKQAEAERVAAAARNKALDQYVTMLQGTIRRNISPTALEGISGNPAAEVEVVQIPTGEVISVRLTRSSGYPRYDEAVQRAVMKASPLPLPTPRELFSRVLKLTFRPQDK